MITRIFPRFWSRKFEGRRILAGLIIIGVVIWWVLT